MILARRERTDIRLHEADIPLHEADRRSRHRTPTKRGELSTNKKAACDTGRLWPHWQKTNREACLPTARHSRGCLLPCFALNRLAWPCALPCLGWPCLGLPWSAFLLFAQVRASSRSTNVCCVCKVPDSRNEKQTWRRTLGCGQKVCAAALRSFLHSPLFC